MIESKFMFNQMVLVLTNLINCSSEDQLASVRNSLITELLVFPLQGYSLNSTSQESAFLVSEVL